MKKIFAILSVLFILPSFAEEKAINNLTDYFQYLPNEVHKNWTPYKSNKDYEVTVQFVINKDGQISNPQIVNSTNERANSSVLNALKTSAPFKPLPASYKRDSVKAQVELQYRK